MSELESLAKPVLTNLILGAACTISPEQQAILSRWISLKIIVLEHGTHDGAVTSLAEREAFMQTGKIPENLVIRIARCGQERWVTAIKRDAHLISLTPTPPANLTSKNIQEIVFGIGELLVHVVHCTLPGLTFNIHVVRPDVVIQLHQPTGRDLVWPPMTHLQDNEVLKMASCLNSLWQSPNFSWTRGGA